MYSMTAYGRACLQTAYGLLTLEMHSVNRKGLDLSVFLPKGLLSWDVSVRKRLKEDIQRGQVTLRLSLQREEEGGVSFEELKKIQQSLVLTAEKLGYGKEVVTFPLLLEKSKEQAFEKDFTDEEALKKHFDMLYTQALQAFQKMRKEEGSHLKEDLKERLRILEDFLSQIEDRKDPPLEKYQKRILEKLSALGTSDVEAQERLIKEVAILAEKLDITEEVVRLRSHFSQGRSLLEGDHPGIGRTLEFLIQEMGREINTMGSKSADSDSSALIIAMKGELEKMREQVQNLE